MKFFVEYGIMSENVFSQKEDFLLKSFLVCQKVFKQDISFIYSKGQRGSYERFSGKNTPVYGGLGT